MGLKVYYNDNNPKIVDWLKRLIVNKRLPDGWVDDRNIQEVKSSELKDFDRVHLFAGIGGWELAFQLANWPIDRKVWSGSCPCQDFSQAGKGKKFSGERHLWPEMLRLIRESKPDIIFGEQVAGKGGFEWIKQTKKDMVSIGYEFAYVDMPASVIGAPHKRNRIYFVSHKQKMSTICLEIGEKKRH